MKSEKPVGRVAISSPARPKMDSLRLKIGLINQYPINPAHRDCSRMLMTARDPADGWITPRNVAGCSRSYCKHIETSCIFSANFGSFREKNKSLGNNSTLTSSLNVSGFTTLNNNTTLLSSINISDFTTLNNNTTLLSSLNISGRTIIGNDNYNYSDSSFEVNKNLTIRNYVTSGSRIDMQVGLGTARSYISLEQGYDINLFTPSGGSTVRKFNSKNNCTFI
jgi:hypothetical protein